jgi:hypothetical protein
LPPLPGAGSGHAEHLADVGPRRPALACPTDRLAQLVIEAVPPSDERPDAIQFSDEWVHRFGRSWRRTPPPNLRSFRKFRHLRHNSFFRPLTCGYNRAAQPIWPV